jgi:hypothetical protein
MRALQFGVIAAGLLLCSRMAPQAVVRRMKINPQDGLSYLWISGGSSIWLFTRGPRLLQLGKETPRSLRGKFLDCANRDHTARL